MTPTMLSSHVLLIKELVPAFPGAVSCRQTS